MAVVTLAFKTRKFEELGLVSWVELSFARATASAATKGSANVDVLTVKIASRVTELRRVGFIALQQLELFAHGLKAESPSALTWLRSHYWEESF